MPYEIIEEFKTENYNYEQIAYSSCVRFYRLEPSENLNNKEMEGALVKRRITLKEYYRAREGRER
jgi:hypothetical protein